MTTMALYEYEYLKYKYRIVNNSIATHEDSSENHYFLLTRRNFLLK